ncbi:MAG: DUF6440 family protein [Christensenellales bacterium]|jgi:hypothetical protein
MIKNHERFVRIYKQGAMRTYEIIVDRETGVNYLFATYGGVGGITPLLDKNGYVVVTDPSEIVKV